MVEKTTSNPPVNTPVPANYFTNDDLKRETLGRISSLARTPIYVLGLFFQTLKTVLKAPLAIPFSLIACCLNTKSLDSVTLSGLAKSAIYAGELAYRVLQSLGHFFEAPPVGYLSLRKAFLHTGGIVFAGRIKQDSDLQLRNLSEEWVDEIIVDLNLTENRKSVNTWFLEG